jgi:hypothetical protein
MIVLLIVSLLTAVLAGIYNSFTDTCECWEYYKVSLFKKYPENIFYKGRSYIWKWYPGTTDVERFFGSSKYLVAITDFWHWSELGEIIWLLTSMGTATLALFPLISYWSILVSLIGVYIVSSTVFDYMFHKGLKKENKLFEWIFIKNFVTLHNLIFKKNGI